MFLNNLTNNLLITFCIEMAPHYCNNTKYKLFSFLGPTGKFRGGSGGTPPPASGLAYYEADNLTTHRQSYLLAAVHSE